MASFDVVLVEAAIERIKKLLNLNSDSALSRYLDVNKQTLSNWKHKGTLDIALIKNKLNSISLDWLLHGIGNPYIKDVEIPEHMKPLIEMGKRMKMGIEGKSHLIGVEEPTEEYKTGIQESKKIPIYYGVSAGNPVFTFDDIKEYYKYDYLLNERIIGIRIYSDDYTDNHIYQDNLLLVDTARVPTEGNILFIKNEDGTDLYLYSTKKEDGISTKYIKSLNQNENKKNRKLDKTDEIIGVLSSVVKSFE